jgi:SulP family sulfate permease
LFFVTRVASLTRLEPIPEVETMGHARVGGDIEAYRLMGSLFFGAVDKLEELTNPARPTPKFIVLSLSNLLNLDTSGIEALNHTVEDLKKRSCRLLFSGAQGQPLSIMKRSSFMSEVGEENFFATTVQALEYAAANLKQERLRDDVARLA